MAPKSDQLVRVSKVGAASKGLDVAKVPKKKVFLKVLKKYSIKSTQKVLKRCPNEIFVEAGVEDPVVNLVGLNGESETHKSITHAIY